MERSKTLIRLSWGLYRGGGMKEVEMDERVVKLLNRFVAERPKFGYEDAEEVIRDALRRFLFQTQSF